MHTFSSSRKKIVLIGAGNVATQLGLALHNSGQNIITVYSRTEKSGKQLANKLDCESTTNIKTLIPDGDIYIIAIKDSKVAEVFGKLNPDIKNKIFVHTSGALDLNVLKSKYNNYGVMYPLQTFIKNKNVIFKNVPILIEANNTETGKIVYDLAEQISEQVEFVSTDARKRIHLAAVFASNFTNFMYSVSEELLKKDKLKLDLLMPLIEETFKKIKNNSPVKMQTGPAVREDQEVLKMHTEMLKNDKDLQTLYKHISKMIAERKDKSND